MVNLLFRNAMLTLFNNHYHLLFLLISLFLILQQPHVSAQLSDDFYAASCPNAESIITSNMLRLCSENNVVPIGMLRLFAHDCFVEGCDGSILISDSGAERQNTDNLDFPQNPFDAIAVLKEKVEEQCPGVVSCADILAIATRDAVVFSGGPSWKVSKGRRDGRISQASRVDGHLPGADFDIQELLANFAAINLDILDLVALSGAHTLGFAHCHQFTKRIYNFSPTSRTDPALSPSFVSLLQAQCPESGGDPTTIQSFDISTPFLFDNMYFKHLLNKEGLLVADSALTESNVTFGLVSQFAENQEAFFAAFALSMIKLGAVGVKTGSEGEIRRVCSKVNGS